MKQTYFSEQSRREIEALVSIDPRIAPALRKAAQDGMIESMCYATPNGRGCVLGHAVAAVNNMTVSEINGTRLIHGVVDLVKEVCAKLGMPSNSALDSTILSGWTLSLERELRSSIDCAQELIDILDALELIKQTNATVVEEVIPTELVGA